MTVDSTKVQAWLEPFRERLEHYFQGREDARNSGVSFQHDHWQSPLGSGLTSVLENGQQWDRAAVNFSHIRGKKMPVAATERHPELAGMPFEVMGTSLIIHPRNPYVPTTHMNVRLFVAGSEHWWFGGGFDLTPVLPNTADCEYWHQQCKNATDPFGEDIYPRLKEWCDDYFYLPHREETRGVGGLFFDDFNELSFEKSFAFIQSVGEHFLEAYAEIVARNDERPFTEREKAYQLYRRGRYVEFNLLYDRGTRFGLNAGGRAKSIFVSMPPEVVWQYDSVDEAYDEQLKPYLTKREWL